MGARGWPVTPGAPWYEAGDLGAPGAPRVGDLVVGSRWALEHLGRLAQVGEIAMLVEGRPGLATSTGWLWVGRVRWPTPEDLVAWELGGP